MCDQKSKLIAEIFEIREQIKELNNHLATKQKQLCEFEQQTKLETTAAAVASTVPGHRLTNDDIARYSRQLILPDFGVSGQLKLKQSSFLIVGVGGLGCPASQYLVAAGCGRVGLVDYDLVDRSNFHRQTLHTEAFVNEAKVESAKSQLAAINPHCHIDTYQLLLNSDNALELLGKYDVVLDCTDNVATRYLLNDACVLLHKPLVSGSALQLDGQLTVYHYGDGPCYRCLFPVPPPPETVTNCGDGGVLGAVTGVIGALQALEAIKVIIGLGDILAGRLLIFDGGRCLFRNIRLRPKRPLCDVCSATPMITQLINYEQFCSMHASDKGHTLRLLQADQRISVHDYSEMCTNRHLLIDVRSTAEFDICRLPLAVNIPLKQILDDTLTEDVKSQISADDGEQLPIVVYCRRGNDSQIAVQHLRHKFPLRLYIKDIVGGLHAWHYRIDNDFPIY